MTPEEVKNQAAMLEVSGMTPMVKEMLAYWKEHRPRMYARLELEGILAEQAMLLEDRQDKEMVRLMTQESMSADDAQRLTAETLLMEPESDDQEEPEEEPMEQPKRLGNR